MKRNYSDKKKLSQTKRVLGHFGQREIICYLLSNYELSNILKNLADVKKNPFLKWD